MTEYTSGRVATWRSVLGRVRRALTPSRQERRPAWMLAVPVVLLVAGLLFTISATASDGVPLREDRHLDMTDLIAEREARVAAAQARVAPLEDEVAALTEEVGNADPPVREAQRRAESYQAAAGYAEVTGPAVTVTMNDALRTDGLRPGGAEPDDLLVHQEDVQAVVNALWAAGAEGMTIMGERIVSTSAVICVGPVLLLHGRPYSPPYEITAVGDPETMQARLDEAPGVQRYQEAVDAYGLGFEVSITEDAALPPYDGPGTLEVGEVPR